MAGATIGDLECINGTTFTNDQGDALFARNINVTGSIYLGKGFQVTGKVSLSGATIGGNLGCFKGATFINGQGDALVAEHVNVAGNIFLHDGFQATGRVTLSGATIRGDLACTKGTIFTNDEGDALAAEHVNVTGAIFLRDGFQAIGRVSLSGATIRGDLDCTGGARFSNDQGDALASERIGVTGTIFLRGGFQSQGRVSLAGATIGGDLDCRGRATFTNENGNALFAESINVTGSVLLSDGFQAIGKVSLYGATIRNDLDCSNGRFTNENGSALSASRANVKGAIRLCDSFQAKGKVNLLGTTIGGSLNCSKGTFINANGAALNALSLNVTGSVLLRNEFQAKGTVSLYGTRIGNTLEIAGVRAPEEMLLDLQFVKVPTLDYAEDSFPAKGNLLLNGLIYEALGGVFPQKWKHQVKWLRLHPQDRFSSQPYEQLAKVLQSTGYQDEAVQVLISKEHDQLWYGKLNWLNWFGKAWKGFLGLTIAYGYRPQQALLGALLVVIVGAFVFSKGYENGLIAPTEKGCNPSKEGPIFDCPNYPHYPKFNPVIYSLDVFLPIIDLRLKNAWLPNANKGSTEDRIFHLKSGAWLRYYFWFQIMSGWALTTLWVAGFTGLVRSTNK